MVSSSFNNPPFVINPSSKDDKILAAMREANYDPNACMHCGICTASCISGRWTSMKTRNIMRRAALGDSSILEDPDIWLCTTCYACFDRCPRDLKVTDAIIQLRNLASARGHVNPNHRKTVELLHETGHAVPINDQTRQVRKELGLPEFPPTIFLYPEERQKMAKHLFNLVREK
jgi:heterodisulfide reductase subunit C